MRVRGALPGAMEHRGGRRSPRRRCCARPVPSSLRSVPAVKEAGVENDVRTLREEKGLTQAQLGKALGVSRQSVNSIEKGKYDPSLPLAIAIARFFGRAGEEIFHA